MLPTKRLKKTALLLMLAVQCFSAALACTPAPNWVEPSVLQQFEKAGQVVYGVVVSLDSNSAGYKVVKLKNVRTLKGAPLQGNVVQTYPGSMCGVDFKLGQDYVLFIPKGSDFVVWLDQPSKAPSEVLRELHSSGVIP